MKILYIAGARPNFVKLAPVLAAARACPHLQAMLVHTGQHYDRALSGDFFDQLALPDPDINLGIGSGTHIQQISGVMAALEPVLGQYRPDLLLVVGDVNSTLAAALCAAKCDIPIAHVEAGLRSRDRTMPEEVNRILTDALAQLLFTTERDADTNLRAEGIAPERIHFVGNPMIDSLLQHREQACKSTILDTLGISGSRYALLTLHRPSNVDKPATLAKLIETIMWLATQLPVVFPMHPRTMAALKAAGLDHDFAAAKGVIACPPLGYLDFLALMMQAALVLTDSGGIQEETTALGVPCLTLRENTERPVTITEGTNLLVGTDPAVIKKEVQSILAGSHRVGCIPELWDGRAGERIVEILAQWKPTIA
jgi:UDP-N-acetylglucosamine 2-epimerase (non-hydrolysing)